jgi:integrase
MSIKELSFSENARSNYYGTLNKHIYPSLGNFLLEEITPAMITALLTDIQRKGAKHATLTKVHLILNGIFKMAYQDGSVAANPMWKVDRPKPRKDEFLNEETDKAYTVHELHTIFQALENEPLKWRCFVHLLFDTGIRRGEACGLQWSDIDFDNSCIVIRHNLQYTPAKGVYMATPKNGKVRTVDIGPETAALLRAKRSEQADKAISQFVFTQENSPDPMHPQTPTRYFKKFEKRYGIKDFHPHKLRHSSASVAITNGADVVSVSHRLGHSDTAVTLRMYAHANEESIRRAGEIAREALRRASTGN